VVSGPDLVYCKGYAAMRQLVLASTSPYRRDLLRRLDIPFDAAAPAIDEEAEKLGPGRGLLPEELVRYLARRKAESLAERYPDALIIGSDQAVELDGRILGKPGTEENAVRQLLALAGRTHRLLTAVTLFDARTGESEQALDVHEVELRRLSEAEIRAYVARDRPIDCAGAYKAEGLGIALFERLTGDDFTAVVGLPLTRVVALLARFGTQVLMPPGSGSA
jgi:septum formation protein